MEAPIIAETKPDALVKIVETSGLEKTKANYILEKFQDYFKIASDWEQKSRALVVSSPSQIAEMKMAREGRLFLRQKRLDIERARKELKEQSLREGKAIDGIANVLKALIEPIEDYLDKQERFVEIKEDEMREKRKLERTAEMQSLLMNVEFYDVKNMPEESYRQLVDGERRAIQQRLEEERRMEAERIANEKAEAEEKERMRLENEKLKRETEAKEKELAKSRTEAEARERKLKSEQEVKLKKEREQRERLQLELKTRAEADARERKRIEDEEKAARRAPDKQKLLVLAENIESFELPEVKSGEAKKVIDGVRELLAKTGNFIRGRVEKM